MISSLLLQNNHLVGLVLVLFTNPLEDLPRIAKECPTDTSPLLHYTPRRGILLVFSGRRRRCFLKHQPPRHRRSVLLFQQRSPLRARLTRCSRARHLLCKNRRWRKSGMLYYLIKLYTIIFILFIFEGRRHRGGDIRRHQGGSRDGTCVSYSDRHPARRRFVRRCLSGGASNRSWEPGYNTYRGRQ